MFKKHLFPFSIEYYTIVGSSQVQPLSNYNVAISSHTIDDNLAFVVGIRGANIIENYQNTGNLGPRTSQLVQISIQSLNDVNYTLYSSVTFLNSNVTYTEETELQVTSESSTISAFIQTDKAVYKGGDTVRFRVLALDNDLRPVPQNLISSIAIYDASQNLILQYTNLTFVNGVYSNQFPLANAVNFGFWKIVCNFVNQQIDPKTQTFNVQNYVTPRFSVVLETKGYASLDSVENSKIDIIVDAEYSFGKYVHGSYNVSAYATTGRGNLAINSDIITMYYYQVIGKTIFTLTNYSNLYNNVDEFDVVVDVDFTEDCTQQVQNARTIISIFQYPYKIEISGDGHFKPNLNYEATAIVTYQDGTPVNDSSTIIKVDLISPAIRYFDYFQWKYISISSQINELSSNLDANGEARITFTPTSLYSSLVITAKYREVQSANLYIQGEENAFNEYLQATLSNEAVQVGDDVKISVETTQTIQYITYIVISSDNNILYVETVDVIINNVIEFTATSEMAPKSRCLVFYVNSWGEMVSDTVDFLFEASFRNSISLEVSTTESEPGSTVDITINATSNSFVGLYAVDERVLKMGNNNFNPNLIYNTYRIAQSEQVYSLTSFFYPAIYVSLYFLKYPF